MAADAVVLHVCGLLRLFFCDSARASVQHDTGKLWASTTGINDYLTIALAECKSSIELIEGASTFGLAKAVFAVITVLHDLYPESDTVSLVSDISHRIAQGRISGKCLACCVHCMWYVYDEFSVFFLCFMLFVPNVNFLV